MAQTLAVKYRPKTLEEVVGQSITTKILKKTLEKQAFKNAYLFAGPSGTGKTTLGRCFANAINNGIGDPIEIDAASSNGVDNVRLIMEEAKQRSLTSEYKIFIIDECHALTSAAWQAFLKGIEETPKYTIFIFCTTEPSKLPETILNRMQRYNISKLSVPEIKQRLIEVCTAEGFTNFEAACDSISKVCKGSMRDALTTLDQCADFSTDLSLPEIQRIIGTPSFESMFTLVWALSKQQSRKESTIIETIESMEEKGINLKDFIDNFLTFNLDLLKFILFKDITLTSIPEYLASIDNPVVQYTVEDEKCKDQIEIIIEALLDIQSAIKNTSESKSIILARLIKLFRELA